jgi:serine/threonine protein kinase
VPSPVAGRIDSYGFETNEARGLGDASNGPVSRFASRFGSYWLLASLGKGAFGEALLAVRKSDVGDVIEKAKPENSKSELKAEAKVEAKKVAADGERVEQKTDAGAKHDAPKQNGVTCEQLYRSKAKKWVVKRFTDSGRAAQEAAAADHVRVELKAPHRNVLLFERLVSDRMNGAALVFEYCNAGDLRRLVQKCQEQEQRLSLFEMLTIATQLCDALCALKKAKILHGDVALRNVFLQWDPDTQDVTVKLGDFGLCRDLGDIKTVTGREHYSAHMAPEIVEDDSEYNEQVDVYAFGVVLYELMSLVVVHVQTALLRYNGEVEKERKAMEKQLLESALKERYQSLVQLTTLAMERDPTNRPTIEQVAARLTSIVESLDASGTQLSLCS